MIDIDPARHNIYNCLGFCFAYPSRLLIEAASTKIVVQVLEPLEQTRKLEFLAPAVAAFRTELARNVESGNVRLLELQVEYNRLFGGPFKPEVYAYESIFTGRSFEAASIARELLRNYRQEGLQLAPEFKDLPDHVSIELEFLARLCGKEIEAREGKNIRSAFYYRGQQRSFLTNHIINWVPAFATKVEHVSRENFYRSLARIMRGFVLWNDEQFDTSNRKNLRFRHWLSTARNSGTDTEI